MPARSLSIVFGTPTHLSPSSLILWATPKVSSPPIIITAAIPAFSAFSNVFSAPLSCLKGFVLEVPKIEPPRGRIPDTALKPNGRNAPSRRPCHPSIISTIS